MEQERPEPLTGQLEGLHAEVMKRVESAPTQGSSDEDHKQVLHQVVGERLGKPQPQSTQSTPPAADLSSETQAKVDELLQRAMGHDLDKAISEARKNGDPLVIDAFHDKLVGDLYDRLVSEGKIKPLNK